MSEAKEGTAAHAYGCAETLMKGMGRKASEYLYEWNQLLLYLGKKKREETPK